ncbi:MAG: fumarate hydratase [Clostridia bacterium]|nr:fumarate hydratase [Clostridia bacterium]
MRDIDTSEIEEKLTGLIREAEYRLTPGCEKALKAARGEETCPYARFALDTALENAEISKEGVYPLCQDTGLAVVMLEIGRGVRFTGKPLSDAVNSGVRRAYSEGLRKSVCDPLTRKNTGDNTPAYIHTEIVEGDEVKITFLPKGFGSENMSKLYMLKPAQGTEGVIDAIVKTVEEAGSRPCPPVYVGVGIGSTFDGAAYLSKKALCRDVGTHSEREDVAAIEAEALKRINALGIGCQGFKGDTTAIGVACEVAPTHIAGLPVAVNIQCHCVRCAKGVV